MADRNFQKKKRNDVRRKRRPVLIFTGEDKNGKYSIQFVNTGFDTDPRGMLKSMESAWKRYELSAKNGDKAYIVLDMDCNPRKVKLVKELEVL